jgi:hypothetical protein
MTHVVIDDPQYIRLSGLGMNNEDYQKYVSNMSDDIKWDVRELFINNNNLNGKISFKQFPNLNLLNCVNNDIEEIEEPLPQDIKYLHMYNNKLTKLPKLPEKLMVLSVMNNKLTTLPELPLSLHGLFIHELSEDYDCKQKICMNDLSYRSKKSLVYLLNKKAFRHDLNEVDLFYIKRFKSQQRDVANFKQAICLKKNYDELCNENRNNKILQNFYKLFVVINVMDFLGQDIMNDN